MKKISLLVLFLIIVCSAFTQTTKVKGTVVDKKTGEPLPLVNIVFCGTNVGVTTDFDGNFSIETRQDVNAIQASFVGYQPDTIKIATGNFNSVNFKLQPLVLSLEEATVYAGENPAIPLMKKVVRNKKRNNPDRFERYSLKTYTKMQLDFANIKSEFKNKRFQRNFGFVMDYVDTSVINGKPYLPVMISEAHADYYYQRSPRINREVVNASRISGVDEDYSLAQFTGHLHANVNLYDNHIDLFDIKLASPLSDFGNMIYKYYLIDSMQMDGRKVYQLRFHPRNVAVPVFDGEFYIDAENYALVSVKMKMMKQANVNWIRDLVIEKDNSLVQDSIWFVKRDRIFADFSVTRRDSSKMVSFFGTRDITYMDVDLASPIPRAIAKMDNNVKLADNVLNKDENFWQTVRPYALTEKEQNIYGMVDSIKNTPLYRNIYDILNTALFGYYDIKGVGIGPYYKIYSFNKLEGNRYQLGFQTSSDISKKIQLEGYAAYSQKLNEWHWGSTVRFLFNEQPTSMLTLSYKDDFEQLGASVNSLSESNILTSLFNRGDNDRLTPLRKGTISWDKEWREGLSNKFEASYKELYSSPYVPFIKEDGTLMSKIKIAEVGLQTRWSKDEMVVRSVFNKYSLGSEYPIITFRISGSSKEFANSEYNYLRLGLNLQYNVGLPPIGTSNINIQTGKILGKVPFPLLKLHEGNSTYFYDPLAFSCMNFYEFASDTWGALFYEHHFKGFFLGHIPILKKFRWREVFIFKGLVGTLADKNNGSKPNTEAVLRFPDGMTSVSKPYFETGVGLENIFRVLSVNGIWRLSHRHDRTGQKVDNFAINVGVKLEF
ncbi:MAG: DUF5686 family protein [Marinifilaceae bacterium]